jgi:hypothetical protein
MEDIENRPVDSPILKSVEGKNIEVWSPISSNGS